MPCVTHSARAPHIITVTLTTHQAALSNKLIPRKIAGVQRPFLVIGAIIARMPIKTSRARTRNIRLMCFAAFQTFVAEMPPARTFVEAIAYGARIAAK